MKITPDANTMLIVFAHGEEFKNIFGLLSSTSPWQYVVHKALIIIISLFRAKGHEVEIIFYAIHFLTKATTISGDYGNNISDIFVNKLPLTKSG